MASSIDGYYNSITWGTTPASPLPARPATPPRPVASVLLQENTPHARCSVQAPFPVIHCELVATIRWIPSRRSRPAWSVAPGYTVQTRHDSLAPGLGMGVSVVRASSGMRAYLTWQKKPQSAHWNSSLRPGHGTHCGSRRQRPQTSHSTENTWPLRVAPAAAAFWMRALARS